ncbi:reverse transcriptase domain-containing protein [Tanacetum coccineum]
MSFGTYAYRRMPFDLCNAPATFQMCMLAIFHDIIEESIEVFMDDFSVFGNSFDNCLNNLDKMRQHCKDAHLVLNWEKCHFMVKEGIMLGHKVSEAGLEVDKAKINVISKLPPPTNIKENVAADHLSQIKNDETSDDSEVDDNFPRETLMEINTRNEPWFADFANYLEEPYLFKVCSDDMIRRCISGPETRTILDQCHHGPIVRHYGPNTTAKKVLDLGFYWPFIIKEAHTQVRLCEACQKTGNISKHDEMPLNSIQWVEAQALPTNDARVVITFLKKLFSHFGMLKALISDRGTHFCNKIMEKTMKRYGVNHQFSTSYHPQISGQVENTNRALKRILEKIVKDNPAIWSRKFDDALWAFRTAYKTPTRTTPYKLVYGKKGHLAFEIEHRAY